MDSPLAPLRGSVGRLHQLTRGLDDAQLQAQSYDSEWSIADVLSHIGSGAVIMRRNLEDVLAGRTTPDDFAPSVWDEWNKKSARVKADDALVTDEAVTEALEAVSPGDRTRVAFPMGPITLDFDHAVAMRLNEHAFHTWDVEVVFDDGARLPHDATAVVVDNLELRGQADRCDALDRRPHLGAGARLHRGPVDGQRGVRRGHGRVRTRSGAARRGVQPPRLRPARPGAHAGLHRRRVGTRHPARRLPGFLTLPRG